MEDPIAILITAFASVLAASLASAAFLKAWRGWLELKRLELAGTRPGEFGLPTGRIELADLRERVRKLEAIANGTDI